MKTHNYQIKVEWIGNEGYETLNYKSYNQNHKISSGGKDAGIMKEIENSSEKLTKVLTN